MDLIITRDTFDMILRIAVEREKRERVTSGDWSDGWNAGYVAALERISELLSN